MSDINQERIRNNIQRIMQAFDKIQKQHQYTIHILKQIFDDTIEVLEVLQIKKNCIFKPKQVDRRKYLINYRYYNKIRPSEKTLQSIFYEAYFVMLHNITCDEDNTYFIEDKIKEIANSFNKLYYEKLNSNRIVSKKMKPIVNNNVYESIEKIEEEIIQMNTKLEKIEEEIIQINKILKEKEKEYYQIKFDIKKKEDYLDTIKKYNMILLKKRGGKPKKTKK